MLSVLESIGIMILFVGGFNLLTGLVRYWKLEGEEDIGCLGGTLLFLVWFIAIRFWYHLIFREYSTFIEIIITIITISFISPFLRPVLILTNALRKIGIRGVVTSAIILTILLFGAYWLFRWLFSFLG